MSTAKPLLARINTETREIKNINFLHIILLLQKLNHIFTQLWLQAKTSVAFDKHRKPSPFPSFAPVSNNFQQTTKTTS